MTKFHFRLASVLRLRQMQLAVEEEQLQLTLSELRRQEQALAKMQEERAAAIAFVQNQTGAGHAEMRALSAFLLGTSARASQLREGIQTAHRLADEQRQRVTNARRNELLLTKLKQTKLSAWQAQYDHELEVVAQETWRAVQSVLQRQR